MSPRFRFNTAFLSCCAALTASLALAGCSTRQPELEPAPAPAAEIDPSLIEDGDPSGEEHGPSGLRKINGGVNGANDYCNGGQDLCVNGEGDCDGNGECAGDLICPEDNGGRFNFNSRSEVCVPPHCMSGVQDGNETGVDCGGVPGDDCGSCTPSCAAQGPNGNRDYCSYHCKCDAGQGDCDAHDQCTTGYCGRDNGPLFGMPADFDVCTGATCQNGRQDPGEGGVDCGGPCPACPPPPVETAAFNFTEPNARIERAIDTDEGVGFVAIGPAGMACMNLSNPNAPVKIGGYTPPPGSNCTDLVKTSDKLYVACDSHVACLDVSNPASPTLISTIPTAGSKSVAVLDDVLYVGVGTDVHIYDVSNPASPSFVGPLGSGATAPIVRVWVDGRRIYCLYSNGRLVIASGGGSGGGSATTPLFLNALPGWPNATDLVVRGGIAYCAYYGRGLVIYDLRNALAPRQLYWDGGSQALRVDVRGTALACIYGNRRFLIANVSNPRAPAILSSNFAASVPTGVAVFRNAFTFCGYGASTIFYDVPPFVAGTSPPANGGGSCGNASSRVFFSTAMNPATINSSSVQVVDDLSQQPRAGSVSYSNGVATFTPSSEVPPGTYAIKVAGSVLDTRGTQLSPAAGVSSTFRVTPVCVGESTGPATIASGAAAAFSHAVNGPAGTTISETGVRIGLVPDPTLFVESSAPLGSGAPGSFNSSWTAATVSEATTYYRIPYAIASGVTYYGPATAFTVTPPAPPQPACQEAFQTVAFSPNDMSGWTPINGTWSVDALGVARQSSVSFFARMPPNVLRYDTAVTSDLVVQVDAGTPVGSNSGEDPVGIAYRIQDPNNLYRVHFFPNWPGGALRFEKIVNGVVSLITSDINIGFTPQQGQFYTLRLELRGNQHIASIKNGTGDSGFNFTHSVSDSTFTGGAIGLTNNHGPGYFRNVKTACGGPAVVGLVLSLDAGNPASFGGSGNQWRDLSGQGYHTSVANYTFVPDFGGGIRLPGNQGLSIVVPAAPYWSMSPASMGNTLEIVWRKGSVTGHGGHIIGTYFANGGTWQIFQNSAGYSPVEPYAFLLYANGSAPQYWISGTSHQLDEVALLTVVQTGQTFRFYKNGVFAGAQTRTGFNESGSRAMALGTNTGGSEAARITFHAVRWYSRPFTAEEVNANFQAVRSRYGL